MVAKKKAKTDPVGGEPELTGAEALRLKEVLDGGGALDDPTLLRLLKADTPCEELYSKACKGKTSNPNCLCGLVPAPGAARRAGLWAKTPDALAALGGDPAAAGRRAPAAQPAGLRNLGATCYVNSVLQCLFACDAFRSAVYAAAAAGDAAAGGGAAAGAGGEAAAGGAPPAGDVLAELRDVFAALQHGAAASVDPSRLAAALQLDAGVQQDGQEFMKLFLSLLEARFGACAAAPPGLASLLPRLFRGEAGYETVCRECGRPSAASARADGFYELDVPVRGFASLGASLEALLGEELLTGDNRYACEGCGRRCDASRRLRVRALPPLLCLSLQRFVFDMRRMDRVKVADKFAFPLELRAGALLRGVPPAAPVAKGDKNGGRGGGAGDDADAVYDLAAILIHKGASATHGHYVAHVNVDAMRAAGGPGGVRGGGASGWWRFDDEAVTPMEGGPVASADHGGGAKAAAGGGGAKRGGGAGRGRGRGRGGRAAAAGGGDSDEDFDLDAEIAASPGGGGRKRGRPAKKAVQAQRRQQQQQPDDDFVIDIDDDGDGAPQAQAPAPGGQQGPAVAAAASEIVSSSAYMLVYRRRGAPLPSVEPGAAADAWLAGAKARFAAEYDGRAAAYATAKEGLAAAVAARQAEVRGLVEAAAAAPPRGDAGRFVAADWLAAWADAAPAAPAAGGGEGAGGKGAGKGGEAPPPATAPVDNAPLLCPHGRLDPAKVRAGAARRLPTHAWEALRAAARGGPELAPADACPACLGALLAGVAAAEDTGAARGQYVAVAAALLEAEADARAAAKGAGSDGDDDALDAGSDSEGERARKRRKKGGGGAKAAQQQQQRAPRGAFLVSRAWLSAWVKRGGRSVGAAAPTAGLVCRHGGLAPEPAGRAPRALAVPADLWAFLHRARAGEAAAAAARARGKEDARRAARLAAGQPPTPTPPAGGAGDVVCIDTSPAAGAEPEPEANGGAAAGEPEGGGGAWPEFPSGAPPCAACVAERAAAARAHSQLAARLAEERAELAALAAAGEGAAVGQLHERAAYALVPAAFMAVWRAYIAQAGRRGGGGAGGGAAAAGASPGEVLQPPALGEAVAALLCACHGPGSERGGAPRLAFPPPPVANRRGRWQLADAADVGGAAAGAAGGGGDSPYELVAARDWEALLGFYPDGAKPVGPAGISATLAVEAAPPRGAGGDAVAGQLDDEALIGDDYTLVRAAGGGGAHGSAGAAGRLATRPEVCAETVAARVAAARAAALCYEGAELTAELAATEAEAVAATAPAPPGAAAERKSRRARRNRAPLTGLSSSMTLGDLKLRLLQALDVHPRNALLFARGRSLGGLPDEATLAAAEIFPGDELRVVDTGAHDADDLASLFPGGGGGGKRREAERGFTGTALVAGGAGGAPAEAKGEPKAEAKEGA